jgi:hypothetical protein
MSRFAIAFAVWAALTSTVGVVMALARTGPDEAKSNLSKWIEKFGLRWLAARLRSPLIDQRVFRAGLFAMGVLLFIGGLGVGTWWAAGTAYSLPKSPIFHITELDRWHLTKEIHNNSPMENGRIACSTIVSFRQSAQPLYDEVYNIMYYSGWLFKRTPSTPSFPSGISLFVASDSGVPFQCGSILRDFLRQSVGFDTVSLRVEPTLVLKECNNQCIDMRIGDVQ